VTGFAPNIETLAPRRVTLSRPRSLDGPAVTCEKPPVVASSRSRPCAARTQRRGVDFVVRSFLLERLLPSGHHLPSFSGTPRLKHDARLYERVYVETA